MNHPRRTTGLALLIIAGAAFIFWISSINSAAIKDGDTFLYESYQDITWQDLLQNRTKQLAEIRIPAKIYLPRDLSSPAPLMILMHGSGGVTKGREDFYARQMNSLGIVALVVDSFSPRGLDSIQGHQESVQTPVMISDLYRALELIRQWTFVDPHRVGVLGFSKGGAAAVFISDERFHQALAPMAPPFALGIAFYPPCATVLKTPQPNSTKTFFFLGEKDTFTPASQCEHQAKTMTQARGQVQVIKYPEAYHGWDLPFPLQHNNRDYSYGSCRLIVDNNGVLRDQKHSQIIKDAEDLKEAIRLCATPGIWVGATENTAEKSLSDLKQVLLEHL